MPELMKDRPAYVRFEKRPIEDREASLKNGHYTAKDIVYAIITPPGGKLIVERRVESAKVNGVVVEEGWLDYLAREVGEGRFPEPWLDMYRRAFEKFLKGEEAPLQGTPIKDWPPLSPAQKANLIAMNIYTVEDLATLNAEGQARFGMGVVELQRKAKIWLEEAQSIGAVVARMSALEISHEALLKQNKRQTEIIAELQAAKQKEKAAA